MSALKAVGVWLVPPLFADDAEKTRVRAIRTSLLIALLMIATAVIVANLNDGLTPAINLAVIGLTTALLFNLYLVQRGAIVLTVWFIPTSLLIGLTVIFYLGEGIYDILVMAYLTIIVIASLLLGKKGALVFGLLTFAATSWLVSAELLGLIAPVRVETNPSTMAYAASVVIGTAVALYVMMQTFAHYLNLSRQNERALAASNHELQLLRVTLEAQTAERTQIAAAATAALREKMWLITGQTRLNEVLHGEAGVASLAQKTMATICLYLEAPVGTLFVREERHFIFAGGYGVQAMPIRPFQPGEGLIGQAAQKKQPVTLLSVDSPLLAMFSSTDEQSIAYMIALPCLYENRVVAVLELAHWRPFTPAQMEYLATILEPVALAIHLAQTRTRMADLLKENHGQL